jgi:hypothetical protein
VFLAAKLFNACFIMACVVICYFSTKFPSLLQQIIFQALTNGIFV